jgi:SAM-dependent methyltransferase
MSRQNIYDNEIFFEGYKRLREREANANNLFEIPSLLSMLPDLSGKRILDLGCGFGEHCRAFVARGAEFVMGVDISERMLTVAREENSDARIEYRRMPMEDIDGITERFDLVVSSLAIHYVENFGALMEKIYGLLSPGGVLVYSQEHPLVTCHSGGDRWTRDAEGNKLHVNISRYGISGERQVSWFVDHLQIYHRTFSEIVNTLISVGFVLEQMVEPLPDEVLLSRYPDYADLFHKPDFLLIRARKGSE